MESKNVPKFDFATIPPEDTSDFQSLAWYQALLNDPAFTPIGNRSPSNASRDTKRRTFFSKTLWTRSTIRASQCFYKGYMPARTWSGKARPAEAQTGLGECRTAFSLGDEVSGGMKGFAHGGLIATLLDEALGTPVFVQGPAGCATAELTVKYERALPIPAVVLCRSWVEKTEGRKVWIKGVLEDGNGLVFATGESLYIKFRERL